MSNQVYRNKSKAIPYNGELNRALIPLVGSAGGAGNISVNFVRMSPTIAGMQITSTTVGALWNNSLVLASSVAGIPLDFRPALAQSVYGVIIVPGPLNVLALFEIHPAGDIVITHPDTTGAFGPIPTGTVSANQLILWATTAI